MPHDAAHCKDCRTEVADHGTRCDACATKRRKRAAELRQERRTKGLCLTCGKRAACGKRHCKTHLAYYLSRYHSQ